jgi:hypothetical protein
MLVSGFQLEFGPGSATTPAYTSSYELELTNLSDTDIRFDVLARVTRFFFTIGAPPSAAVTLANLKRLIGGVIKSDHQSWYDSGWYRDADGFVLQVTVPVAAGTSEIVEIAPSIYDNTTWWPQAAGHVEVVVPAIRLEKPPYNWVAQANGPVAVLVNPSTVERWLVKSPGGGGAFNDSRTSPPLASGQAYGTITPDSSPIPIHLSVRDYLEGAKSAGLARAALLLTPEERAQVLIDLLATIDDDAERAALNGVLEGLGSSTRIARPE